MTLAERRKREAELAAEFKRDEEGRHAANVKRNIQRVKEHKPAQRMSEAEKDRSIAKSGTKEQKIRQWQTRAAEMESKAKAVERSKTGNTAAAATYRKAKAEYLARVKRLQESK